MKRLQWSKQLEKDLPDLNVDEAERREEKERNEDGGASRDIDKVELCQPGRRSLSAVLLSTVSILVSVCC